MAFNPKENRFTHSLPGVPGTKSLPAPGAHVPGAAGVAHMPRGPLAPVTPHVMPVPGQKHKGPNPNRWDKLQQYLEKPAAPIAPVKPEGEEPV